MVMRIALVHAVTAAMDPVREAFERLWPAAERVNPLDDALAPDRERDGQLTPAMAARIGALADYAVGIGAHGILFTCSAFGDAIEAAALRIRVPVLKPNEAMFEEALAAGSRVAMLTTSPAPVAGLEAEFQALARARRASARLEVAYVPEAMKALKNGDAERHNRLLADAAKRFSPCDALMLVQVSASRAAAAVTAVADCPVLTSPDSAVRLLRARVGA